MKIIVGLGNPTKEYAGTRHNVGFSVIYNISDVYNIPVETKKHKALIGKGIIEGEKVILAMPQTYMNLSGESVRELMDYYKCDLSDLIVIYDDISLDVGKLRIRAKGTQWHQEYHCAAWHTGVYTNQDRCRRKAGEDGFGGLCAGAVLERGTADYSGER